MGFIVVILKIEEKLWIDYFFRYVGFFNRLCYISNIVILDNNRWKFNEYEKEWSDLKFVLYHLFY
jgi:hypothetical protein